MASETRDFFKSLFGHPSVKNMFMYEWSLADKMSRPHRCGAYGSVAEDFIGQKDLYFGLGLSHNSVQSSQRIKINDVYAITCLWLDIDLVSPYRSKEHLPSSLADIQSVLDSMPPCTWQIDSGYGVHMYWVFDEPFIIRNKNDKDMVALMVKRWNTIFARKFNSMGFALDTTSLAQILRIPGTVNGKNPDEPRPVKIIVAEPGETHNFDDLNDLCCLHAGDVSIDPVVELDNGASFKLDPNAELSFETMEIVNEALPKFRAIWDGEKEYPSQSERDLAIATQLKYIGMEDQIIVDAMIHNRRYLSGGVDKLRPDYYMRTLSKASTADIVISGMVKAEGVKPPARKAEVVTDLDHPADTEESSEHDNNVDQLMNDARDKLQAILGIRVERLLKILSSPPCYKLMFTAGSLESELMFPSVKDIVNQRFFRERMMEVTNFYAAGINKKRWDLAMTILLPMAEELELGEGGTDLSEFKVKVNMFLSRMTAVCDDNGISRDETYDCGCFYRTLKKERVDIFVRGLTFMTWHNREGFPERLSLQQIAAKFYHIGAKPIRVRGINMVTIQGVLNERGVLEI